MAKKGRRKDAKGASRSRATAGRKGHAVSKSSSMEAVIAFLRKRPKAAYADVRESVERAGHTIYPIVYGRAKALLGLIPTKRRRRAAGRRRSVRAPRAAPRVRRVAASTSASLDQIRSMLQDYERVKRERDALRDALEAVRKSVRGVVA